MHCPHCQLKLALAIYLKLLWPLTLSSPWKFRVESSGMRHSELQEKLLIAEQAFRESDILREDIWAQFSTSSYLELSTEELMLLNCSVCADSWVPWTARRSNQSILKKISPEYSLEGPMLKLKLQYFGQLMQRTDSLERTVMLGMIKGGSRRGMTEDEMVGWHHWLNGHEFE